MAELIANAITSIETIRLGMILEGGGSIIYPKCVFLSLGDFLLFVPKAVLIAFFAPFPAQWAGAGTHGSGFRFLAGAEMFALYLLYPYAAIGLLKLMSPERRS